MLAYLLIYFVASMSNITSDIDFSKYYSKYPFRYVVTCHQVGETMYCSARKEKT